MLTVHVRISDAATGKPTPVRLRLVDAGGVCRMPFGRQAEFALGPARRSEARFGSAMTAFAYIDGVCEVQSASRSRPRRGPQRAGISIPFHAR